MISYSIFCGELKQYDNCSILEEGDRSSFFQLGSIDSCPPEKVAEVVVKSILLPTLINEDSPESLLQVAYTLSNELLKDPPICSAMILPLTADIARGEESLVANPIGKTLILVLQDRLPQSRPTLIQLLNEIKRRSIADTIAPCVPSLLKFFCGQLKNSGTSQTLELLRSVLVTYSNSYKTLKILLLRNYSTKTLCTNHCHSCGYKEGTSVLLDLFHSQQESRLVCSCIISFLDSFPLDLWLDEKSVGSMRLFSQSLKEDLVALVRSMICCFSYDDEFMQLVYVVLSNIPYSKNIHDNLTNEAVKLVEKLGATLRSKWRGNVVSCFCDCAGGRPQPHGSISPMVLPMSLWLCDSSSLAFKTFLLENAAGKDSYSSATRLIGVIVRMHTDFICLEELRMIVLGHSQTDGMKLLIDFLSGRNECTSSSFESASAVSEFIVSTLNTVMNTNERSDLRHLCLQGYCLLLPIDWAVVINTDQTQDVLDNLKRSCKERNNKEKAISFKAIGEMLIKCFTQIDNDICNVDWLTQLCREVEPLLESALNVTGRLAPTIKSMVIFAAGNLAFGIRERQSENHFVRPAFLAYLMEKICHCIDHSNEKIVGNAIRSIGHIGFLAFHHPYASYLELNNEATQLFILVVVKLCQKVRQASKDTSTSSMSWKERSSAKKHGWGACHALGHILCCSLATKPQILNKSQEACGAIVSCINKYELLNEKIIVAAGGALQRITHSHLVLMCHRTGILGTALSGCLNIVINKKSGSRLQAEIEDVMNHILPIISVLDAEVLIRAETTTPSSLWLLYEWMVENVAGGSAFEKFAIALEQAQNLDIRLEQNFASRASFFHRKKLIENNRQPQDDEI